MGRRRCGYPERVGPQQLHHRPADRPHDYMADPLLEAGLVRQVRAFMQDQLLQGLCGRLFQCVCADPELVAAMRADGADLHNLRVDGGMVSNDWLCQFLADVCNLPIERPRYTETTALGAAVLAALGAGEFANLGAAAAMWGLERDFLPIMSDDNRERLMQGWHKAVQRAL